MPADWFSDEQRALLSEYCRTLASLAFIDAQLDELEASEDPEKFNWGMYLEVMKRREALARLQVTQATKMRLTQQSRYRADRAAVKTKPGQLPRSKPWESQES